jgi:hypothetical protein
MVEAELRAEQERTTSESEPPVSELDRAPDVEVERMPSAGKTLTNRPTVAREEIVIKQLDPRAEVEDAWDEDAPPTARAPDLNAPTKPPPPGYEPNALGDPRPGKTEPPVVE